MFKNLSNGAFEVTHPTTRVKWVEYSKEKAIARYGFLNNLTFGESLEKYLRS